MPNDENATTDLLIALNAIAELSRDAIYRLASELGPASGAPRRPSVGELSHRTGLSKSRVRATLAALQGSDRIVGRQRRHADRAGATILSWCDTGYPEVLRDLPQAPPVIHFRGRLSRCPGFGIVGSRNADPYGLEAAEQFGRHLAAAGLQVVSGLARGVDGAAHRGALSAGGDTVAILACGLDRIYPRAHTGLAEQIAGQGAVVSEFPFGCPPMRHHFPIRNRLIAALGIGTLVVQATVRSGSLITAGHALDLGRQVWAVPGSIFDQRSAGTNRLLRDGAFPALAARDIVEALPGDAAARLAPVATAEPDPVAGNAAIVLSALEPGRPRSAEEVAQVTGLAVGVALATLSELELASRVRRYPGPVFARRTF